MTVKSAFGHPKKINKTAQGDQGDENLHRMLESVAKTSALAQSIINSPCDESCSTSSLLRAIEQGVRVRLFECNGDVVRGVIIGEAAFLIVAKGAVSVVTGRKAKTSIKAPGICLFEGGDEYEMTSLEGSAYCVEVIILDSSINEGEKRSGEEQ